MGGMMRTHLEEQRTTRDLRDKVKALQAEVEEYKVTCNQLGLTKQKHIQRIKELEAERGELLCPCGCCIQLKDIDDHDYRDKYPWVESPEGEG